MARDCPDCKTPMADDGVHAWCIAADCEFRGNVVVRTGKFIRGTDWQCPDCNAHNYGAECKECGVEFAEIHS